jgi:hypothetical protein
MQVRYSRLSDGNSDLIVKLIGQSYSIGYPAIPACGVGTDAVTEALSFGQADNGRCLDYPQ